MQPRVLVIDDGLEYARIVEAHLGEFSLVRPEGEDSPARIADGPRALEYLQRHVDRVDVVLLDMRFEVSADRLLPLNGSPSESRLRRFQGVAILQAIREHHPELPVVLLTAQRGLALADAGPDLAGQSVAYVLDGDDLDTLRMRINTAYQNARLSLVEGETLWGQSQAMRTLRRRLATLARGTLPVLLEGETGVGKSFLAERCVHARSGRDGPFVIADLASIPGDLIAAHLFGATRGSYTGAVADRAGVFALADGGSLFLDEIQNVPLDVQRQLLVVLQERRVRPLGAAREQKVDVKVIASSNEPLGEAVRQGRFRQDLYMRLGPATRVSLPPLRERDEDFEILLRELVARSAEHPEIAPLLQRVLSSDSGHSSTLHLDLGEGQESTSGITLTMPSAGRRILRRQRWPGNMRELAFEVLNLIVITLIEASDAVDAGLPLRSSRLQIDPGLVAELLRPNELQSIDSVDPDQDRIEVEVKAGETLNGVSVAVERQYFLALFHRYQGDFGEMANHLLGDPSKARAVQLRFNQIGLRVRQLRRG